MGIEMGITDDLLKMLTDFTHDLTSMCLTVAVIGALALAGCFFLIKKRKVK